MLTSEKSTFGNNIKKAKDISHTLEVSKLQIQDRNSFNELRNLQNIIEESRDKLKDYPRTELRATVMLKLDKIYNGTSSALDLLSREEFDKKDTKKYLEKLTSRLHKIDKVISSLEEERLKAIKKKEEEGSSKNKKGVFAGRNIFDLYDSKDYVETPPKDDSVIKAINNSEDVIKHYQKYARQLPATEADSESMGDFIINRMPVVALTDPAVNAEEWDRGGFITKSIGFYAVLENQLIIGVHENKLKKKKADPKTYMHAVLSKVQRELHKKLDIIGSPTGYKNSGYIYYWVVPEKNIDQFHARNRKPLKVKKWYFAFR